MAQTIETPELVQLRQVFLDGQQAASRGRIQTAENLHKQLLDADYPLAPYLEMSILIKEANDTEPSVMIAFMEKYKGTWLEEKLRLNWLNTLRSKRDYQRYVDHFVPGTGNTIQRCFYLEALHRVNRLTDAYEGAKAMWLVGESQPDQCDYIFDRWRRSDQFSDEYIWQRYILARREGEIRFSDYLARQVDDEDVDLRIRAYQTIRSNPEVLGNTDTFIQAGAEYSPVIAQGLRNLAVKDLQTAIDLWPNYRAAGVLTAEDMDYALDEIIDGLEDDLPPYSASGNSINRDNPLYNFARENRDYLSDSAFEQGALNALRRLDWQSLLDWLDLMSYQQQEEEKWVYWRARALNQIGLSGADYYDKLVDKRSYYGFLSSLLEDTEFALNQRHPDLLPLEEIAPEQLTAWQRAAELERVEYFNNSRLTWYHANDELTEQELASAADWAASQELHSLSIRATIQAKSWDYLSLRFPLAYLEHYENYTTHNGLSLPWVYALSRQESNFARSITSPAGAKGLMQLMPATAREAAGFVGIRYDQDRLAEVEYNIELGTDFLARAYEQLDENIIYTSAAYNAGVSRIRGWLTDGRDQLPLDVWVELIPFNETKSYVKNLMMFSAIYADKLDLVSPLEELDADMFLPPAIPN